MIEKLLQKVLPHFDIVKTVNGEQVLYLRRFFLVRSKLLNVYLHKIARSDDDPDPHDHPWSFVSLILKNGYMDQRFRFLNPHERPDPAGPLFEREMIPSRHSKARHLAPTEYTTPGMRTYVGIEDVKAGRVVFRKDIHIHRVLLYVDRFGVEKPAWTLVFTRGERRPWGFVTKDAWVYWRKYLNLWGDDHA